MEWITRTAGLAISTPFPTHGPRCWISCCSGRKEHRRFPLRYGRDGSRRVLGMGNSAGQGTISSLLFIAEVYNPGEYKNYLFRGKFDYLYDKVGLYDTLRAVTCGYESATAITRSWQSLGGIEKRMLNFLENHDEQRIASDFLPVTHARRFRHSLCQLA